MAQIKAQGVNWLDQAWRISSVIADMPDNPPGLLAPSRRWPALEGKTKFLIEHLQDTIALHLAYRAKVIHKISIVFSDGNKQMFWLSSRTPEDALKHMVQAEQRHKVKLQPIDLWAYDAHIKLGRILIDRYVCKEWKRILPLIVASIGGETTSQTAMLKAKQTRGVDRRSTLTKEVAKQRRFHPKAQASEILDRLCGGDVVKELKDERVWYWDAKGQLKDICLDRFDVIFASQKPSMG